MGTEVDRETLLVRGFSFIVQARLQIDRLCAVFDNFERRWQNSNFIARWQHEAADEDEPEYRRALGRPRLRVSDSWAVANERYLVIALLAQVEKVAAAALPNGGPPFPSADPIRKVRDMEEHWEEEGRAVTALRERDPRARPAAFRFGVDPYWIGDFTVDEARDWLELVESGIRANAEGVDVPWPEELVEFNTQPG